MNGEGKFLKQIGNDLKKTLEHQEGKRAMERIKIQANTIDFLFPLSFPNSV